MRRVSAWTDAPLRRRCAHRALCPASAKAPPHPHRPSPDVQKQRVQIWLYEQPNTRLEGRIAVRCLRPARRVAAVAVPTSGPRARAAPCSPPAARLAAAPPPLAPLPGATQGFDEYMNVVLDDTEEVDAKRKTRTPLGRILLKGDNITLITGVQAATG